MNRDQGEKHYVPFGPCFIGVGKDGWFKLGDIQISKGWSSTDIIQVLEPTKAAVSAIYRYVSKEEAVANDAEGCDGWWNQDWTEPMDNVEFPIGSAFLANFGTKGATINFAGQVPGAGEALECAKQKYVMFANIVPRTAKLGEFVIQGGWSSSDIIQVLEPSNAGVCAIYRYVSKEEAAANDAEGCDGWWNQDWTEPMDNVEIPAGAAFLGNFGSENLTIIFPQAIK